MIKRPHRKPDPAALSAMAAADPKLAGHCHMARLAIWRDPPYSPLSRRSRSVLPPTAAVLTLMVRSVAKRGR